MRVRRHAIAGAKTHTQDKKEKMIESKENERKIPRKIRFHMIYTVRAPTLVDFWSKF